MAWMMTFVDISVCLNYHSPVSIPPFCFSFQMKYLLWSGFLNVICFIIPALALKLFHATCSWAGDSVLESWTRIEYWINELEIGISVRNNLSFLGTLGHFLHGLTIVFFQEDNVAHSIMGSKIKIANKYIPTMFLNMFWVKIYIIVIVIIVKTSCKWDSYSATLSIKKE